MTAGHPPAEPPRFALTTSRQLPAWMAEQNLSLAFTTYQAGKVFLLGLQPDGRLDIFNRSFERCMGLCVTPDRLWLSSLYQLWRFENALELGQAGATRAMTGSMCPSSPTPRAISTSTA